ncbi:MAG: hypothetical protein PHD41_04935 [Methanosarcinaceae archaeon]|nr:hypothetical protein [Methanosarcinaceae archaeon]
MINIRNKTSENLLLHSQKLEKGMFKKGYKSPDKIEPGKEICCKLVACEGQCEGGADIEGWIKYSFEKQGGSCKLHFKYRRKEEQLTHSCTCLEEGGRAISCEHLPEKQNKKKINWTISPKS